MNKNVKCKCKYSHTSLAKVCQTNDFTFYKQFFIQSDLQDLFVHYKDIDFFHLLKDKVIMNKS